MLLIIQILLCSLPNTNLFIYYLITKNRTVFQILKLTTETVRQLLALTTDLHLAILPSSSCYPMLPHQLTWVLLKIHDELQR